MAQKNHGCNDYASNSDLPAWSEKRKRTSFGKVDSRPQSSFSKNKIGHGSVKNIGIRLSALAKTRNIRSQTLEKSMELMEIGSASSLKPHNIKQIKNQDVGKKLMNRLVNKEDSFGNKTCINVNTEEQSPEAICTVMHECKYCNEVFYTEKARPTERQEEAIRRGPLNFDLNEFPSDWIPE